MFNGYILINDHKSAIECGEKILIFLHDWGATRTEGKISFQMAQLYQRQCKYEKAKELYMKSLNVAIATCNRQREGACYGNLGTVFYSLGEYAKAEEYLQKALKIRKEIGDINREATNYGNLGAVFQSRGEYVRAEEYLQKALKIKKEIGDKNGEAASYGNLGIVFLSLGEYVTAEEYLQKALKIRKEIGDKNGEAASYGNLGTVFQSLGEHVKAEEYHKKALKITKEIGHKYGEATVYGNLGTVFCSLGENVKAEEYHKKALKITKEIGDKNGEGGNYGNLGNVFYSRGEYVKAEEYLQKALKIKKEIGDNNGEATVYGSLGVVFQSLGEYVTAEEYLQKALKIKKEIGDVRGEATDYGNLGTVFHTLGEYVRAEEYLQKALTIRKEIGDKNGEAVDYGNLGNVFYSRGEYVKAEEYLQKALKIKKEISDKNGEATVYGSLGMVFQSLGEYVTAEEYLQKALKIKKEIGDVRGEATDYGNLGTVFHSLGEYVRAEEYLQKALKIRKEIGDKNGEAADYGNLGMVFLSLGEYVTAEEYLQKALKIRKEIGDKNGEAVDYGNLGTVFQSLGEYVTAEEYLQKALKIQKEIGNKKGEAAAYGNLGTVLCWLGQYSKAKVYHEKSLELSYKMGYIELQFMSHLNLAWDNLELGGENIPEVEPNLLKSIQKCEEMRVFLRDKDQFKICFFDEHVSPYQRLSILFCSTGKHVEALYVVELGRARALADIMSAQYSVEQHLSANPHSWVGIEKILKAESNCVCLYIAYAGPQLFLWIIKSKKAILFRYIDVNDYYSNKEVKRTVDGVFSDKALRSFRIFQEEKCEDRALFPLDIYSCTKQELSQQDSQASPRLVEEDEDLEDAPPSLSQCYKMIIAPVADLLDEPEIIIVPDRVLYKVPFAALEDENGKPLSESFRIRIAPSLSTLKLIQDSPADYHSQTGALIVGDPEVGNVTYKGRPKWISPLDCARKEAEMIGRLLGTQPLIGENATKRKVLENIHSVSLMHFAAHGNAERGEIALAPSFPTNGYPIEEDYLLTMAEISSVRLTAKLVVLSCCHSARGQIRSEGVVGIARAFLASGARSVLVALWAIQDKATEQFMSRFYEHLVGGESASESLHQAMKWMRANGFSDKKQWAPFMLIGDNVTFDFGK